jgi:hypothetical protein
MGAYILDIDEGTPDSIKKAKGRQFGSLEQALEFISDAIEDYIALDFDKNFKHIDVYEVFSGILTRVAILKKIGYNG